MSIRVSLTDFLTFNACKSQRAKRHYIIRLQNRGDYSVSFDFWRDLRLGIKALGHGATIESLMQIADNEPDNKQHKRANYHKAVRTFTSFINHESPELFSTDAIKNVWKLEDKLTVNVAPEIGMRIKGTDYLVKIYFKVKNPEVNVREQNVALTLAMVKDALSKSGETRPCAILNLQNGKLITENQQNLDDDEMDLELEALNFVNTWNRTDSLSHS